MIYKLHPSEYGEWKRWYPELINSELEIISDNMHDIYYYIGNSDYVVGISSTVLFEAVEFDVGIMIIKERDYRKAEILYQNGFASLITSESELEEKVVCGCNGKQRVGDKNLFMKNSVENIKRELKKILIS